MHYQNNPFPNSQLIYNLNFPEPIHNYQVNPFNKYQNPSTSFNYPSLNDMPVYKSVIALQKDGGRKPISVTFYPKNTDIKDNLSVDQNKIFSNIPSTTSNPTEPKIIQKNETKVEPKIEEKSEQSKPELKQESSKETDTQIKQEKVIKEDLTTKKSKEKNEDESDSEENQFKKDNKTEGNGENDKNNEEDDEILSSLSEDNEEEADQESSDYLLAQYEKVHRVRNKWKVVFKDAILHCNGKEYVFEKVTGELDRDW